MNLFLLVVEDWASFSGAVVIVYCNPQLWYMYNTSLHKHILVRNELCEGRTCHPDSGLELRTVDWPLLWLPSRVLTFAFRISCIAASVSTTLKGIHNTGRGNRFTPVCPNGCHDQDFDSQSIVDLCDCFGNIINERSLGICGLKRTENITWVSRNCLRTGSRDLYML